MKRCLLQKPGFVLALIFGMIVVPPPPISAADIVIDSSITHDVYGNSNDSEGDTPSGAPTNNTVYVTGDSVKTNVEGDIFGASSDTEDVIGNTVTLDGRADAWYDVAGGYAGSGSDNTVADNKVVMNDYNAEAGYVLGGWSQGAGEVSGNDVIITDSWVAEGIFGGNGNGAVSDNRVTLNGNAEVGGDGYAGRIYGGGSYDGTGTVSGNTVTINNGTVNRNEDPGSYVVGGEGEGTSLVTNNTVTINNGFIYSTVQGGKGFDSAEVIGNHVDIHGVTTVYEVYGGYSGNDGNVNANTVTVDGNAAVDQSVTGGFANGAGDTNGNFVTVGGAAEIGFAVTGGSAYTGTADGNTVTLTGSAKAGSVTGGDTWSGTANGNTVTLSDSVQVDSSVRGGNAIRDGAVVNGNTVTLNNNAFVDGAVYGGSWSNTGGEGEVSGNSVTINDDAKVDNDVYGGYSNSGDGTVIGNSVTINGGTVTNSSNGIAGGVGRNNSVVSENTVTINDGTINADVYGGRGYNNAEVSGNEVVLNGGTIQSNRDLVGGSGVDGTVSGNSISMNVDGFEQADPSFLAGGDGDAEVSENSVILQAGTVSTIYGGRSGAGGALGNRVGVAGGRVNWDIYGGQGETSANDNTVEISGGSVGTVYGGFGDTEAINNTVTIMGDAVIGAGVQLLGGKASASGDAFTGNTLNLMTQASVSQLGNFEFLNFYVPADVAASGDAMLTVNGIADLTDGAGRSSVVNVGIDGNSSVLKAGDSVVLIDATRLDTNSNLNETAAGYGKQGSTLDYTFDIVADTANNELLANVRDVKVNSGSKALSEGFFSSLALASQGADLVAGEGLGNAMSATPGIGFNTFAAISGSSLRYNTGSHVDVDSLSLMAGIARGFDLGGGGRLTLGAFFEYGRGVFDTFNDFADGEGDLDSVGGGVLGRVDFADSGSGHFYTEASARIGRIDNEFGSDDLFGVGGRNARYDASSSYYSLHAGVGYAWFFGSTVFDVYGKYFWTRQGGDSVRLSTGDPVVFEDIDSHRVRAGVRLTFNRDGCFAPYVGAAYEHEFDGRARATAYGLPIDAADMRGGTGVGEIGFTFKPSPVSPFSFDLGIRGYVGARENVAGSLRFAVEF